MLQKSYRLKLARLLKLYQEVSTDRGLLIAENDDVLTAGVEVFVENENGEIVPAADGVYVDTVNKLQYVVEGGTIKEVVEYKDPEENTIEDNPDGTNNNTESNETGSTSEVENNSGNGEEETKPEGETQEAGSDNGTEETGSENGQEETGSDNGQEEKDPKDEQIAALTEENTNLKQQIAELQKIIDEYKQKEETVPAQNIDMREKFEKKTNEKEDAFNKKLEAAKRISVALGKK